ncbi:glutamate-cysteine ligase family protein [Polaribacter undariae]|uniref:Glutamate-cysteine ligase family protein n=1 Tax=Polaribacter sejongensis TaxID=985043 RepID=A0AAJ1VGZ2_9FLAO|nr:glutamate-cysteine ligase family protein [Polaribacter undariae]MDN3619784.1 glutamate-cysteine ligase family protein [Polaribacter undariae]UWD31550.1 glutamate-cysteine ligase family protein [Polaribacter undariae]
MAKKYKLFEVYGIELEYMLINDTSFKVAPIVDTLLTKKNGELTSDIENGAIAWSNELVAHVVEIKTNGPTADLTNLADEFHKNIVEINALLKPLNTKLLPTACHPLMKPVQDTQLWKHSYSEVYELYNRIFDCKGHGWSNVQSTHINLPFYNDTEFEKLHAAIRVILPLIPGLCASSPILEGKLTGFKDTRLEFYKNNQKEIPEMTGSVIPEQVFSKSDYHKTIFDPIKTKIKKHDTNNILDHHFLNSRGAIARFDRNAIEIRLVDIQECPKADVAICVLIIEVLKQLVNGKLSSLQLQMDWKEQDLFSILDAAIKQGEDYKITNKEYLAVFNIPKSSTIQKIWKQLFELVKEDISENYKEALTVIFKHGTLATRIENALSNHLSEENIINTYNKLADCLETNTLFIPNN